MKKSIWIQFIITISDYLEKKDIIYNHFNTLKFNF